MRRRRTASKIWLGGMFSGGRPLSVRDMPSDCLINPYKSCSACAVKRYTRHTPRDPLLQPGEPLPCHPAGRAGSRDRSGSSVGWHGPANRLTTSTCKPEPSCRMPERVGRHPPPQRDSSREPNRGLPLDLSGWRRRPHSEPRRHRLGSVSVSVYGVHFAKATTHWQPFCTPSFP